MGTNVGQTHHEELQNLWPGIHHSGRIILWISPEGVIIVIHWMYRVCWRQGAIWNPYHVPTAGIGKMFAGILEVLAFQSFYRFIGEVCTWPHSIVFSRDHENGSMCVFHPDPRGLQCRAMIAPHRVQVHGVRAVGLPPVIILKSFLPKPSLEANFDSLPMKWL
jgi:hypothetical protein